eukprot:TRINITY_DN5574_c1_g1_i1.p1 TRINITY_DN5574_c1_g1~~TRINITY_DN5574_c1_g1_i1.p1  ORF type:complete len:221 (+),score=34.90 TRINITY_DN5574_c1_g1_i1:57-665(+)
MIQAALAVMLMSVSADPKPNWPVQFQGNFTEETWFEGGYQRNEGWVAYSYAQRGQVIFRPNGKLNPICNDAKRGYNGACIQQSVGETRYLIFPALKECCQLCDVSCGVLKPTWVTAVPYLYAGLRQINNQTCNVWTLSSDTPDAVGTMASDPDVLCTLYDGGASHTGDNPFHWQMHGQGYSKHPSDSVFALPSICHNAGKCN